MQTFVGGKNASAILVIVYAFNLFQVMHGHSAFLWKLSHWTGCVSIAKHNFDDQCTDVGLEVASYIVH